MADGGGQAAKLPPVTFATDPQARNNNLLLACGLAWLVSLIHVQAAIDHVDEYLLYAVFFAILAAAQFWWGVALYRAPRRSLLIAGAVGCIAVAAMWFVSRTVGLPIGPDVAGPEPAGALDTVAAADEIAVAALMILQLRDRRAEGRGGGTALRALAMFLVVVSSLVLAGGLHAH